MAAKATSITTFCWDLQKIIEGILLTMLLSVAKAAFAFLKNDKFLKLLIIFSAVMFIWYIGIIPVELNHITVWTPTYILVDVGAAITSVCAIVFIVLYLLVMNKLKKLGFSGIIEWLED